MSRTDTGSTAPERPSVASRVVRAAQLRLTPENLLLVVGAPALAILFAALLTSLVLLVAGHSPVTVYRSMADYGSQPDTFAAVLNKATTYYLSALAVAIGFKMGLFNIGVDGQYRLAALVAAAVGGAVSLPAPLHVGLTVVVAMLVGAMWAGLAGVLRETRGVSEVISTIMLNAIATSLASFLLNRYFGQLAPGSNNLETETIEPSGRIGGLDLVPGTVRTEVFGFVVIAVVAGLGYWPLLNRTRFGFDLRAVGVSKSAALASGVNVKRMVVSTMLLSGAVAGLVGMPELLGNSYAYGITFPAGIGFIGIAIALLGRNHPVGIALAALLWGYLDQSSQILDIEGVPKEVVIIMQGTIVLCVVIAYELVRRFGEAQQQKRVSAQLASEQPAAGEGDTREAKA
jgi:general nucleoside transport system permease protein